MDYERRQIYRGSEKFIDLPNDPKDLDDAVDEALAEHPDNGDVMSAVVLKANAKQIDAVRANGDTPNHGRRPAPRNNGLSGQGTAQHQDPSRRSSSRVAKTPRTREIYGSGSRSRALSCSTRAMAR